jgi:hypothetical protein
MEFIEPHDATPLSNATASTISIATMAAAATIAFGLWVSFRYTFGAWAADSDVATPIIIWKGVLKYGLNFVAHWRYTEDNWLFTAVPVAAAAYELFGAPPWIVTGLGWLSFVISVGLTSFLMYRSAGSRAAFVTAVILLFPNSDTIGPLGFLSYFLSHNVSMLWGLGALALAICALNRRSIALTILAGLCVFANVVSDPWAAPAIGLPLLLVSAGVIALNWRSEYRPHLMALCLVTLIAVVAGRTRLFGVLYFLPPTNFHLATVPEFMINVGWFVRDVTVMFNIVPRIGSDHSITALAIFCGWLGVTVAAAIALLRRIRQASIAEQLIVGTIILSGCGVISSFLLNQWGSGQLGASERFFPNLYYFSPALIIIAAAKYWETAPRLIKLPLIACAILFVASGITSYPRMWLGLLPIHPQVLRPDLISFLEKNSLSYGYGAYWPTEALSAAWVTHDRLTIRPVVFANDPPRISSDRPETSSYWYGPKGLAESDDTPFLVISGDDPTCADINLCTAAAIHQFGAPAKSLRFGTSLVLVWNHPIANEIGRN